MINIASSSSHLGYIRMILFRKSFAVSQSGIKWKNTESKLHIVTNISL